MPWSRPHRGVLLTFVVAAFSLGIAAHIVVAHNYVLAPQLSDPETRIVTACLMLAAITGGFGRMEWLTRTKTHELANGQNTIANQVEKVGYAAEVAAGDAKTASVEAKTATTLLDKRLNGELDQRIRSAVKDELSELHKQMTEHLTTQLPVVVEAALLKLNNPSPKVQT